VGCQTQKVVGDAVRSEARDRPRLTAKGKRTRARIVEAAAGLFYERGVAGTSLDAIRSAAGVSGSQLSHYFAGKDELVQAVIGYQAATITGNQRQADLSSPRGLRAWRDMVIAEVKSSQGLGGCPLGSLARRAAGRDRRAGPRPDRGRIRAVVGRHQRRTAPSSRRRAPPGRHRPGRPRRHPPRRTPRRPPPRPGSARHPPSRNRRRHRPRARAPQPPGRAGRRRYVDTSASGPLTWTSSTSPRSPR